MRQSSRRLLEQREAALAHAPSQFLRIVGYLLIAGLIAAPVWIFYAISESWSVAAVASSLVYLFFWRVTAIHRQRMKALADSRTGESICQFARRFMGPEFDPAVVRAVYQSVQSQLGKPVVPIRAEDSFETDLELDGDDLDEIATHVSRLARRQLEPVGGLPLSQPILTVGDLVRYFIRQPRLSPA